jgi:hypothetical protein
MEYFMPLRQHIRTKIFFKDPTHVNFITDETHEYFSGPLYARPYGFKGKFKVIRVEKVFPRLEDGKRFISSIKSIFRSIVRRKKKSHLVWELQAIK